MFNCVCYHKEPVKAEYQLQGNTICGDHVLDYSKVSITRFSIEVYIRFTHDEKKIKK